MQLLVGLLQQCRQQVVLMVQMQVVMGVQLR
jgi:hypothetical protein